jgi:hypothetical protein
MIYELVNTFLLGTLFIEMIERRFPNEFNNIIITITLNSIYIYSVLQIAFKKANNQINEFIESKPVLLKIKNHLDTLIGPSNGMISMTQFFKNGKSLTIVETSENNFDFAIYSWLSDDKKCINKKIIYDMNEQITKSECSDIKFMLVEIQIGENAVYKIDLKTADYNFYLVGNKFTKDFFIYYLINHLNIDDSISNKTSFRIKIIDHNVNSIHLNFNEYSEGLILEKDSYKLLCKNHNK